MKYSVVVPVYRNEESIPRLVAALDDMNRAMGGNFEAVLVVDGSPDRSFELLREHIRALDFSVTLIAHSRNFGSFPAIRTGLAEATGHYFGVMAADLQEPPELVVEFFRALEADECDVALGTRVGRKNDPTLSRLASSAFWSIYRRLIVRDMPEGGVDVFGCNRQFRDQLLQLEESRSSLVALIFWLGFRRTMVGYERQLRIEGKSAWTFRRKLDYMMDSIFAFTDFPIRLLIRLGAAGAVLSALASVVILIARFVGFIQVPGYVPTMLSVLFFGTLNLFGLGLVGTYAWRGYENSKRRPLAIVANRLHHVPGTPHD
ncbi:glycosyltransferase involved in cell wall biosynthesis [Luteibacter sp. HA06]